MKKHLQHPAQYIKLFKEAGEHWNNDNIVRHSAALAYYTIFSLAPLLIIAISVAGMIFGREASEGRVVAEFESYLGRDSALAIQNMIRSAWKPGTSLWSACLGGLALLVGASGVLNELKSSLNLVWHVQSKPFSWRRIVFNQTISYAFLLGIGFLLLVSLLLSALLAAAGGFIKANLAFPDLALHAINIVVDLAMTLFLFASIFKWLPDAQIQWRDVWIGSGFTSLLFIAGKLFLSLYIGRSGLSSAYGSAGSLIVIMVWVYYSAIVFYSGAEFTKVYSNNFGSRVRSN